MITLVGCTALLVLSALPGAPATPPPAGQGPANAKPSKTAPAPKAPKAKPPAKPSPSKAPQPAATNADTLADKVQAYYDRLQDYSADFIQRYTRAALSRTTESRGKLFLKKPGMMRWEYEKPAKKLFIADGKKLVVYDPEFEQVIIDRNFKTEKLSSSVSFLWGKGKLKKSFEVRMGDPKSFEFEGNVEVLELIPKKDATYARLILAVTSTGEVMESVLLETSGNTNHFKFRNPAINKKMADTVFAFDPPKDAYIEYR